MTDREIVRALAETRLWDMPRLDHLIRAARQRVSEHSIWDEDKIQEHLKTLLEEVAEEHNLPVQEVISPSRKLPHVLCRLDFIEKAHRRTPFKSRHIAKAINRAPVTVRSNIKNHIKP